MKAYLASGIFSDMERDYNEKLAKQIRERFPDLDLYLPQENKEINDKSQFADAVQIATADNERLDACDFLFVVLDGIESGQGRCAEIGYAAGKDIPIFGLWTDSRQEGTDNADKIAILQNDIAESQFAYINLYVIGLIKNNGKVANNVPELLDAIAAHFSID
ncbi:MAG: nucleoside 2-deoxyribosyltransferase [Aerococcus sp.]|nr:nucleoside 2-deoxyribosyltransferase [Aerococcus sp.]